MTIRLLMAALLILPLLGVGAASRADVTVNNNALDALGKPAAPTTAAKPARPQHHTPPRAKAEPADKKSAPVAARPTAPPPHVAAAPTPLPPIPLAAPPAAAVPPPAAIVPTRPALPLPAIPLVADAPGGTSPIDNGLRVTFGPDRSDLNAATVAALRTLAATAKASPATSVNVAAYAAGTPEDPSTPRRLSLSRALAARAVLVNEGIPSTRVYVRAMGTNDPGGGPADRVDVTIDSQPAQAQAAPATPARATATP